MTLSDLYNEAIVARARSGFGAGRLPQPHSSQSVDNPLCGDRVTIDVCLDADIIASIGYVVRGCLLCEAAVSVIAEQAVGESAKNLYTITDLVQSMLESELKSPIQTQWGALEMFRPVADYPSRHLCVLLPFQALVNALKDIESE